MVDLTKQRHRLEKGADKATRWIGSTNSLVVHTIVFIASFVSVSLGVPLDRVLLILTTVVSLEAIYLAIFIQMTVNKNTADIEVIQEDVGEIAEDVQEMERDVDEIQKDIDEIQGDVDEIQKDVLDGEEPDSLLATKANNESEIIQNIERKLIDLKSHIEQLKKK